MRTPPAKFCNVPLKAMPMARPIDANMATNEAESTPSTDTITTIRMIYPHVRINVSRKL